MKRNRWLTALAAVGIHMSIGSVYAWSVLTRPVMETMGLSLSWATWAFSIAILFLGLSAGFLGPLVERLGPSRSGMVSAVFFSTGLLGTAAAVHCQSAFLLYLFYGAIGGIGLGTGYITPVSTLVKWFPRHRGFATGLAIMGFGFAALIAGPAMRYLVDRFGLTENFLILAAAYAMVMILSASYIRPPRKGEIPMLLEEVLEEEIRKDGEKTAQAKGLTRKEAMHTWKWYVLWWIFFTNITCGIGLLAVASPMAQEIIGMSAAEAASLVGIIGIVNGAGRILWASVSDWIGRGVTYMIFFAFEVFAFYALAHVSDALLFEMLVLAVISCYGAYALFDVTHALDKNLYICGMVFAQVVTGTHIGSGPVWFTSIQNIHSHWTRQLVYETLDYSGNIRLIEMGEAHFTDEDLKSDVTLAEVLDNHETIIKKDDPSIDQMTIFEFIENKHE